MKKPTINAQKNQNHLNQETKTPNASHRVNVTITLSGDWTVFDHENPNLKPGLYWAVGLKPRSLYNSGQGITPFQIMIELFESEHDLKILPAASVSYEVFNNCLPHINYVQPLQLPKNPYNQTQPQTEGEQA